MDLQIKRRKLSSSKELNHNSCQRLNFMDYAIMVNFIKPHRLAIMTFSNFGIANWREKKNSKQKTRFFTCIIKKGLHTTIKNILQDRKRRRENVRALNYMI